MEAVMKKALGFIALLLAACAAPLAQVPPSGTPAEVAAPSVRPGDAWAYTSYDGYTRIPKGTVDYRVTGVKGDIVSVERSHEGRTSAEYFTANGAWLERPLPNLQDLRYQPALAALPFPLHAGQRWREYVQAIDPATRRAYRVRIDGHVLGWDRVRVPAGEFDTLKVERYIYAGNADYFRTEERIREIDWYSPQVGAVVRHEESSEHTDTSKSCRYAGCNIILNDWTVLELAKTARVSTGAGD
jgi:hypothetical protein